MAIPIIETERLIMRAHNLTDLEECVAMWADPDVVRHVGGAPCSRQVTWGRMQRYVGHWVMMGYGFWALEQRSTGRFVGEVGFADFKRDLKPSLDGTPEIGWVLASAMHRRGLATEAVTAAIAWGDVHIESDRSACVINPGNAASIRLAHKMGYREFARTEYKDRPAILFERFTSRQP